MTRVSARHVSHSIGRTRIVNDATLDIDPGEFVGVLGPNGSGKSTLLKTIYRVQRPTTGSIFVDDTDLWRDLNPATAAAVIAALTQSPTGDVALSVRDVVALARISHRDNPTTRRRLVDDSLATVGMLGRADQRFAELSGGEKQRVHLARVLCQQPAVLILDEPTNHLDVAHQLDVLHTVRRRGLTTVAVLHDLNLAAEFCDRIYLMSRGSIVCSGTPEQVLTPEVIEDVFEVHADIGTHPRSGRVHVFLDALPPHHTRQPPAAATNSKEMSR